MRLRAPDFNANYYIEVLFYTTSLKIRQASILASGDGCFNMNSIIDCSPPHNARLVLFLSCISTNSYN